MQILITKTSRTSSGFYFSATCERTTAHVAIYSHGLQVCCENAANRVWCGFGRHFASAEAALAGYKSAPMQTIIRAALEAAAAS